MANILLLVVCLVIGLIMQRIKGIPDNTHVGLNQVILHLSLPATILLSVPALKWDHSLISIIFVSWMIFALAYFFFKKLGEKKNWSKETIGCLILTAGLGNTSFVGFPILEALYGKEAIQYGVLIDQPGTFFIVSTFGIALAASFSSSRPSVKELAQKVLFFAPFTTFIVALTLLLFGFEFQGIPREILSRMAATLAPLALVSVGFQLRVKSIGECAEELSFGLLFKLVLAPIFIFFIYRYFNLSEVVFKVVVMEAAMATMLTAAIVAGTYNLRPKLAGLMVGVGVPLSSLTLMLWYYFLG